MKNNSIKLGKLIEERRKEMGLSIRELAKIIDISHTELLNIEKGKRLKINFIILIKLCNVLDLNFIECLMLSGHFEEKNKYKTFEVTIKKVKENKIKIDAINKEKVLEVVLNYLMEEQDNLEENEDIFFEIVELENSNNLDKEAVCKYKNYFSKCSVCSK